MRAISAGLMAAVTRTRKLGGPAGPGRLLVLPEPLRVPWRRPVLLVTGRLMLGMHRGRGVLVARVARPGRERLAGLVVGGGCADHPVREVLHLGGQGPGVRGRGCAQDEAEGSDRGRDPRASGSQQPTSPRAASAGTAPCCPA